MKRGTTDNVNLFVCVLKSIKDFVTHKPIGYNAVNKALQSGLFIINPLSLDCLSHSAVESSITNVN